MWYNGEKSPKDGVDGMDFNANADRMDVKYVAALARIRLEEEEAARLQGQLDDILAYVGELKELDVEGVEPLDDVSGNRNRWNEDEPGECLSAEEALGNAPAERHGQFGVPKIIE